MRISIGPIAAQGYPDSGSRRGADIMTRNETEVFLRGRLKARENRQNKSLEMEESEQKNNPNKSGRGNMALLYVHDPDGFSRSFVG